MPLVRLLGYAFSLAHLFQQIIHPDIHAVDRRRSDHWRPEVPLSLAGPTQMTEKMDWILRRYLDNIVAQPSRIILAGMTATSRGFASDIIDQMTIIMAANT